MIDYDFLEPERLRGFCRRASFSSLRAAVLSGIGVTAFGLGMMPEGLSLSAALHPASIAGR
jgi:hypothetical protein